MISSRQVFFKGLEAFRQTLPEYRQHETSTFCFIAWDVVKALYLIQELKLELHSLDVDSYAEVLGVAKPKDQNCHSIFCHINNDYIKNNYDRIDLTNPVIIVQYYIGKGKDKRLAKTLLDGRHRLRKAYVEGVEELPCYVIKDDHEKLIRLVPKVIHGSKNSSKNKCKLIHEKKP